MILQAVTVAMYDALTAALEFVIDCLSTVITAVLSGQLNALLPLFAIGVVVSVVMLGVKLLRSFTWGS